MESVTDKEAFTVMHSLAKSEGLAVEPATAVAFAGLVKLIHLGSFKPDDLVGVNCTGHKFPVEKHTLGDQWSMDIQIGEGRVSDDKIPVRGKFEAIYQKGSLPPRAFVDQVVEVLEHKTSQPQKTEENPDAC